MPGDPKECRQRALECILLAKEASTPRFKQLFRNLAQSWFRLAAEHEDAQNLLVALNGMEFKNPLDTTFSSDKKEQHEEAA